ncbi:exporter [Brevifollis gellanilyticus]|uniref:Exporter n=2 Tax=Brevifollis gellanilyticus TaxID=748831 RepID=A0A512M8G6_9BACT|nr:exporter [Brevifollis gellanilyticus]
MRLRLETDILATLPAEVPEVRALKLLRDGFAGGSDLIIALEAEDEATSEELTTSLAERLQKRTDLVKEVRWAQPMEAQAESGAALLAWCVQNADPVKLKEVQARLEGDGAKAQLQKALKSVGGSLDAEKVQRASYDPLGLLDSLDTSAAGALEGSLFGLVSEDGAFRVLMVTPATGVGNYKAAGAWLEQMKGEIAQVTKDETVTVRYTGEPAFQAEIGAGIEKDMSSTIGMTEVFIALLFWIMFRRLKPLMWIQGLVMLSMVLTLGFGGLIVGKLSIMSLGFAAIVLGIIVDYAVLIIQEARQHPQLDAKALRKLAAPGIAAGACTTAVVFLSLLFSGLPGLAEMGLLVAIGVIVGLGVMVFFAPKLAAGKQMEQMVTTRPAWHSNRGIAMAGTLILVLGIAGTFAVKGMPSFLTSAEALRPTKSEAMDTFQWVQERLGRNTEASVPVLITGPAADLRAKTEALSVKLDAAVKAGTLVRHMMPTMLVSDPQAQAANKAFIEWLLREQPRLEKEIDEAGFTEAAMGLLRGVCGVWKAGDTEAAAASILHRILATGERAENADMAKGEGVVLASVSLPGTPGLPDRAKLAELQKILTPDTGAWVAGWETLGGALSSLVRQDLNKQLMPIVGLIALTLFITFRRWRDLVLSVLLLAGGLGALAATMSLLGQGWNLASLAAIPLLLGTGIDYGIHILLALQRTGNDIRTVQATTGRAVFFSGMTTVIGFSSLFFAGNRGISSLGLACCLGTLWILMIVLWLLPHWRAWLGAKKAE